MSKNKMGLVFNELKAFFLQKLSSFLKITLSKPNRIYIPLNTSCNSCCKMCNLWKLPKEELPLNYIKKILKNISKLAPRNKIQFSGGEPLLRKDLFEILTISRSLGFYTGIVSNGTLITPKIAKRLIHSGLFNINISLDSLIPKNHDYIRGVEGSFNKTLKGIDNLLFEKEKCNSKTKIIIKTVLSNNNLDELIDIVNFVKKKKLDGISFQALQPNFGSDKDKNWFKTSKFWIQDFKKLDKTIDKLISMKKNNPLILNSYRNLSLTKEYFKNPIRKINNKCTIGYSTLQIYPSGDIRFCDLFDPIGNVYEESNLSRIWYSNKANHMRKKMSKCSLFCLTTCTERRTLKEYYRLFKHFFN